MPKLYEALAEAFLAEGVDTQFVLMGDGNMHWSTAFAKLPGVHSVHVRHEHATVAAATAYNVATGKLAVASVTCGPGVTQLMTALPAAVRARLPLVIFAGEQPLSSGWYNQGIDQAPFVTATGAAYHSLHLPKRMPVAVRDAFVQARQERRPVVIGVPFDLQDQPWVGPETMPIPSKQLMPRLSPVPPNRDDIARALEIIHQAQRIIVMAGLGVVESGATAACRQLAEQCDGLLATTLPTRGLFYDDPFSLGIAGGFSSEMARRCFSEADLVIAVGCSLAKPN